jgi:hypothetical protein
MLCIIQDIILFLIFIRIKKIFFILNLNNYFFSRKNYYFIVLN